MKSIFIASIFWILVSCNNSSTPTSSNVDSSSNADQTTGGNNSNPDHSDTTGTSKSDTSSKVIIKLSDWEIDKPTFNRMVSNYKHCPFSTKAECKIKKHKKYQLVLDELYKQYSTFEYRYDYIKARFDANDVARYKHNRPRKHPENEEVAGHATFLLHVYPINKKLTQDDHYFDICIICPPPNTGTCDDMDDPHPIKK